ncbi:hypothetical protein Tco_0660796 [Tanacetum coccineum]
MSTSTTHQQSLADVGSETRPPMLERCSYIPWASHFRRYLNRKREKRKWLNKAIDEGPFVFKDFTPFDSQTPRPQTEDDLTRDDLKHYEVEIEAMNLILISIPNDIYNSVDSCQTAQAMWQRVKRLMQGTVHNKVDRETRLIDEFDKFVAEPRETLVSYVTQVRLAKRLIEDYYDDLFDYLHQYEKLVNASRAKKLEKYHDPLALVTHTGSSSRPPSAYYLTHPPLVVDYDDDYQGDAFQNNFEDPLTSAMMLLARAITQRFSNPTNNRLRTSSNTRNQAIVQADKVNIQSRNSGLYARNHPKPKFRDSKYFIEQMLLAKQDEAGVTVTDEQNDFLVADATRMEEIKELRPSYDSTFLYEVQKPSTSYVNPLFAKDNQEQKYPKQPKVINDTISDDQINSNIIFDEPNVDVNSGSVEYNNNVQASCELEQLARNAYKEAKKQQIIANKVRQQNKVLTQQLELYKEKMSDNEDKYHDTVLDLEAKVKDNENVMIKLVNRRFSEDIKEMMDVFESMESDLNATWKQNEILNDQLSDAKLKHEIECCVLMSHECVDNNLKDEMENLKRESFEIQEVMQSRI